MPYDFTDERLDNGLRLVLAPDRRSPTVAVDVTYHVGSPQEHEGQTEFAHLFEHLMFEGSGNLAKGEFFNLVSGAGGQLNAMTAMDYTTYFTSAPSRQLELLLWLEAERLATLPQGMTQEKLDNQREVVLNEHRQRRENAPYGSALHTIFEQAFPPGHPYHVSMTLVERDLRNVSLDDVVAFFETHYAPNNAALVVVGDFDPDQVRGWVGRYFGPIAAKPGFPPPRDADVDDMSREVRKEIRDQVPLPRVYSAWFAPVEGTVEYDALEVAVAVLGAGRGSRLSRRLVRELEVAGQADVQLMGLASGRSMLIASATARAGESVEAVTDALDATLSSLADAPPTEAELDRARALLERSHLNAHEPLITRAIHMGADAAVFDDPGRINARLPRQLALGAAEVQAAAAHALVTDRRVVLTYLPEAA